jgi:hypothetical protein
MTLPKVVISHSTYTAILYTENMFIIYFHRNYGYYCLSFTLAQLNFILHVQHIRSTLKKLLLITFNSTNPLWRLLHIITIPLKNDEHTILIIKSIHVYSVQKIQVLLKARRNLTPVDFQVQ